MSEMIFSFIIGVAIGLVAAYFLLQVFVSWMLRRSEERLEMLVKAMETVASNYIAARAEEENGVFYIYNAKDGSFMAQGSSLTELLEHIDARYPGVTVSVTEGETEVLDRLKATVRDAAA